MAAVAAAILVAPATMASAATSTRVGGPQRPAASGVLFVQTDNTTANTVVAYHRAPNGALTRHGIYATGGRGGVLQGSVVDHLASQGSLAYDRAAGLLYAVNAGSDTLTVFAVRGERLQRTQIIPTGGAFPVSVTFHNDRVWVLNALDGGSIQGFKRRGDQLTGVDSWHRQLGLDPDATPQFTHTPGQISFTPDGGRLVVTTKAGANTIDVFPLRRDGRPAAPVVTSVPDAVPFGFAFDPAGRLQVTEAGPNAVETFTLNRKGTLSSRGSALTGQMATCWITATNHLLYASNAGSNTLSGYRVGRDGALVPLGTTSTDAGPVDSVASPDGRYLYVQTGGHGLVDAFRIRPDGHLTPIGSVAVPGALGGEGIVVG